MAKVQAQNLPDLASALRIAQRMESVFKTVRCKASKSVRVVMEDLTGAAVKVKARDTWVEQLAKAIQHLNQQIAPGKREGFEGVSPSG